MKKKQKAQVQNPLLRRSGLLVIGAILAITFMTLSPVLKNGFINMDDSPLIQQNPFVRDGDLDLGKIVRKQLYSPHYKPLVYLTWTLESKFFGLEPQVLHLNNLLLHLFSTLLVYFLVRGLVELLPGYRKQGLAIAGWSALLFGIHPLHVESVAWAVERKDMLFTPFYLLSLLAYLKALRGQRKWLWLGLSVGAYFFSMMSKSMGITLPGVILLIDFLHRRPIRMPAVIEKIPYVLVFFLALYLYGFLGGTPRASTGFEDIARVAGVVVDNLQGLPAWYRTLLIADYRLVLFLGHVIVPVKLALVYPREYFLALPGSAIHLTWVVTLLLALLPVFFKKHGRVLAFGLAFFFVSIFPILMSEGSGTNFLSDRYTYLPSVGILFVLTTLLCAHPGKTLFRQVSVATAILALISAVLVVMSFGQARTWRNSLSLWEQVCRHYPENWYGHYNRGKLIISKDPDQAYRDFTRAIEVMPKNTMVYYARGTQLMEMERCEEAIADFNRALQHNGRHLSSLINKGSCLRKLKRYAEALSVFNQSLAIQPGNAKTLNNRGLTYMDQKNLDAALRDFNTLLEKHPDYTPGYLNRGNLFLNPRTGGFARAVADFTQYLKAFPKDDNALFRRGYALQQSGKYRDAVRDFSEAIRINDRQGFYYYARAQAFAALGDMAKARKDARAAQDRGVRMDPNFLARLE